MGPLVLTEVWWQGGEIKVLSDINQPQPKRSHLNVSLACKEVVEKLLCQQQRMGLGAT